MFIAGSGTGTIFVLVGVVAAIIFACYSANKKMKMLKEESRKREADFFAQNAALLMGQYNKDKNVGANEISESEINQPIVKTPISGANNMEMTSQTDSEDEEIQIEGDERIVVLDGYVLNPGDLSWDGLKQFGEVTVYDRTPQDQVLERMKDATVVITNKAVITKYIMERCPDLKYIGVIATGYNVVDVEGAHDFNITVTNVPGYGTDAVAQFTFSLMLELCNQVGLHNKSVMQGDWIVNPDFSYSLAPLTDLSGKRLGIVGFGSIGRKVSEIALAFGMEVLVYSRTRKRSDERIKWVELNELLKQADIVTLHCPLTKDNELMINAQTIAIMKDGAKLINTARGGLIDETALVNALKNNKLSGAALDVVSAEPMNKDSVLIGAPNLIVTPHIAWASHEARERLMGIAMNNLKQFLANKPVNEV